MKLFRYGKPGEERPGVILNQQYYDISLFGEDYTESFWINNGVERLKNWLTNNQNQLTAISQSERIGPPIARPSKIVCIGLNFSDHAKEAGLSIPPEPVIFFKATTALSGPFDPLVIPKNSEKTDWEVELAVVIGKRASYVEEKEAMTYVAGYCLHNDYSERSFQLERSGQWVKGKSSDSFAPLGPFLATPDELAEPHTLNMWLKINGETVQQGSSSNMIYKIPHLISYVSQFMTLLPGDVISTGTPAGVGMGMKPPRFIRAGDVIELGIEGLGEQKQIAQDYREH